MALVMDDRAGEVVAEYKASSDGVALNTDFPVQLFLPGVKLDVRIFDLKIRSVGTDIAQCFGTIYPVKFEFVDIFEIVAEPGRVIESGSAVGPCQVPGA